MHTQLLMPFQMTFFVKDLDVNIYAKIGFRGADFVAAGE